MPTIAAFDGIKIILYAADHAPPHFHVIHAEHEAMVRIADLTVIAGEIPRSILRKALDWAEQNQGALALRWVQLNEE
jgi:hypothetical protein